MVPIFGINKCSHKLSMKLHMLYFISNMLFVNFHNTTINMNSLENLNLSSGMAGSVVHSKLIQVVNGLERI